MKKSFKTLALGCAALAACLSAWAETVTWTGATDNQWDVGTNWDRQSAPTADDDAVISQDAVIQISSSSIAKSVTISGTAVQFTFSGKEDFNLAPTDGIEVRDGSVLTLSSGDQADKTVTFSSKISGGGGVAVAGAGMVWVTNTGNDFAGGFSVLSGSAKGQTGCFGPKGSNVNVAKGATLEFTSSSGSGYNLTTAGTIRQDKGGRDDSHFRTLTLTGDATFVGKTVSIIDDVSGGWSSISVALNGHTLTSNLDDGHSLQFFLSKEANGDGGLINIVSGGVSFYRGVCKMPHISLALAPNTSMIGGDYANVYDLTIGAGCTIGGSPVANNDLKVYAAGTTLTYGGNWRWRDVEVGSGVTIKVTESAYVRNFRLCKGGVFKTGVADPVNEWNGVFFAEGELALDQIATDADDAKAFLPRYVWISADTTFRFPADLLPGEVFRVSGGSLRYAPDATKPDSYYTSGTRESTNPFYVGEDYYEGGKITIDLSNKSVSYQLPPGKATWVGGAETDDWDSDGNWSTEAAPTLENDVSIGAPTTITMTSASKAKSLSVNVDVTLIGEDPVEIAGGVTVAAGATLTIATPDEGTTLTIPWVISGEGAVAVDGPGTVAFTAANTFTGGFTVRSGTVRGGAGKFGPTYADTSRIAIGEGATLSVTGIGGFGYVVTTAGTLHNEGGVSWDDQLPGLVLSGDASLTGGPIALRGKDNSNGTLDLAGHTLTIGLSGEGLQLYNFENLTGDKGGKIIVAEGSKFLMYGNSGNVDLSGIDLVVGANALATFPGDLKVRNLRIGAGATFAVGGWSRLHVTGEYGLDSINGSVPSYITFYSTTTFRFPADLEQNTPIKVVSSGNIDVVGTLPTSGVDFYVGEELVEEGSITLDTSAKTVAYARPNKSTWKGGAAANWDDAKSWEPEVLPNADTVVFLKQEATVTMSSASKAGKLKVDADVTLTGTTVAEFTEVVVAAGKTLTISTPDKDTTLTIPWLIGGEGAVAVAGAGTVQMTNRQNSFTGGFKVLSGTAKDNYSGCFGPTATGAIDVAAGATLEFTQAATANYDITTAGTIRNRGGFEWQSYLSTLTLSGDARIEGTCMGMSGRSGSNPTINLNGHTLTIDVEGEFQFCAGTREAGTEGGTIVFEHGTLRVYNADCNISNIDLVLNDTHIVYERSLKVKTITLKGNVTTEGSENGRIFFTNPIKVAGGSIAFAAHVYLSPDNNGSGSLTFDLDPDANNPTVIAMAASNTPSFNKVKNATVTCNGKLVKATVDTDDTGAVLLQVQRRGFTVFVR